MQFTNAILATILSATALAAPAPAAAKSAVADVPEWAIEGVHRVCDEADNLCTWTFAVNTHLADPTPCTFESKRGAKPASQTDTVGNVCGPYTVGSGWSDQFGAENGFTTLSIVDQAAKLIVWAGYADKDLAGGAVITPDLTFPPTVIAV